MKAIHPHCISAHIVHFQNNIPHYLLIHRAGEYLKGTWQMVTGGIEEGEKAWEAALREIEEETGIIPDSFYSADAVEMFYMKSSDQIAFSVSFVAFIDNIQPVLLSPREHDAYEWLPFEKGVERLVWSEQKRVMAHIHQNFVLKKPDPIHLCEKRSLV